MTGPRSHSLFQTRTWTFWFWFWRAVCVSGYFKKGGLFPPLQTDGQGHIGLLYLTSN